MNSWLYSGEVLANLGEKLESLRVLKDPPRWKLSFSKYRPIGLKTTTYMYLGSGIRIRRPFFDILTGKSTPAAKKLPFYKCRPIGLKTSKYTYCCVRNPNPMSVFWYFDRKIDPPPWKLPFFRKQLDGIKVFAVGGPIWQPSDENTGNRSSDSLKFKFLHPKKSHCTEFHWNPSNI